MRQAYDYWQDQPGFCFAASAKYGDAIKKIAGLHLPTEVVRSLEQTPADLAAESVNEIDADTLADIRRHQQVCLELISQNDWESPSASNQSKVGEFLSKGSKLAETPSYAPRRLVTQLTQMLSHKVVRSNLNMKEAVFRKLSLFRFESTEIGKTHDRLSA